MADNKKIFRLSKQSTLLASAILFLLLLAWFLHSRIARLTEDNRKNLAILNQVSPGFNNQTLEQLKGNINQLEVQLLAFVYLFDPPDKQVKKDYDMPIYFVEELTKIKQSLKMKASNNKISYPDLGFKETLPDEKEAKYQLKQLYIIRDIVSRGLDDGINFSLITPQPIEDLSISPGMKLAKTRIEFIASAPALIDFLIQISEIVPLDSVESILVKSQDSTFKTSMAISYIMIESDWKDKTTTFIPINVKEIFSEEEKIINSLRANNPFSSGRAQEPVGISSKTPAELPKQSPRFLYLGKAILKSNEVAVIQDTLNQETIFLALGEKTGDFVLKELKDLQIILKNTNTNQEIIVKRQEQ